MTFNLTLVKSQVRSRPYVKTDGKYLGSTKRNNIGLQKVDDDITSVYKVCTTLATMPNTCMVMGTAREPRINNTDRTLKNFIEEPIKLLVLDLDKYPSAVLDAGEPISYKGIKQDVERFITTELPPEFKKVSYILAFSASFLLGANKELRCHLFFLLEEAQYPREIGTWIRQEQIPTDHTFYFNLTQPIFTAAPIWKKIEDPIWVKDRKFPRLSLVKKDRDKVPGGWQPYKIPPRGETATGDSLNLPSAFNIPGKVGSFCRTIPLDKVLSSLGYTEESKIGRAHV